MDRKAELNKDELELFESILKIHSKLDSAFLNSFSRSLPWGEVWVDRWDRAKKLGFGEGTNIYDSSVVIGDVSIGKNCWIGPFTLLDGSGVLKIGDFCTISAGVHIYTHDNVLATLSPEYYDIMREEVSIGNRCYIAPNVIISKGVSIGDESVLAANSFVKGSFPSRSIIAGTPARLIGKVVKDSNNSIRMEYFKTPV